LRGGDLAALHRIAVSHERKTAFLVGQAPDQMESPDEARQEAQAYERLLVGLVTGQLCLPDEAARAAVETAAAGYDEGSNHAEIAANHDALHGLLAVLEGGRA
jgi:hypothetical protein